MVVCEFFFKPFHSRGSNDYLNAWAADVDCMAAEGWAVVECCRLSGHPGFWTVVLGRPAQQVCSLESKPESQDDLPQDCK